MVALNYTNSTFQNITAIEECILTTEDSAWVAISSILVLIMTPAIGFVYAGLVNKGAIGSMLALCFAIFSFSTIIWCTVGYSLVFGDSIYGLIGNFRYAGLQNLNTFKNKCMSQYGEETCIKSHPYWDSCGIPEYLFLFFQNKFAGVTPCLIIGSVSERMYLKYCLLFVCLWTLIVYCPIAHWVWNSEGILLMLGLRDYAGGLVVHVASGFSALIASCFFGHRKTFGRGPEIPNFPYVIMGVTLLWFGWFGFTGGSAYGINKISILSFINTNFAACMSLVVWLGMDLLCYQQITALGIAMGTITGLVSITPGAGYYEPIFALLISLICAIVCWLTVYTRKKYKLFDDLDVFAIHGVAGCLGTIAVGIFADKTVNSTLTYYGYLFGNLSIEGLEGSFLQYQVLSVLLVSIYSSTATFSILTIMTKCFDVRAKTHEELYYDSINLFDEFEIKRRTLEIIR